VVKKLIINRLLTAKIKVRVRVRVFNATFDNISDISQWSVLLAEQSGENH
jgi:hypothetical protein